MVSDFRIAIGNITLLGLSAIAAAGLSLSKGDEKKSSSEQIPIQRIQSPDSHTLPYENHFENAYQRFQDYVFNNLGVNIYAATPVSITDSEIILGLNGHSYHMSFPEFPRSKNVRIDLDLPTDQLESLVKGSYHFRRALNLRDYDSIISVEKSSDEENLYTVTGY